MQTAQPTVEEELYFDDTAEEEGARIDHLSNMGGRLERLAAEQVAARQEIEDRWVEDIRQYNGRYDPVTEARLAEDKTKSRIFVNVTRSKTHAAEARLGDLLLPTEEKNWAIKPTPVPELVKLAKSVPEGDEKAKQIVDNEMQEVKDRADAMEKEIHDQLVETRYNAKNRQAIHDGCLLGTAILKGPVIAGKTKKKWTKHTDSDGKVVRVLEIVDELKPGVERVNPWNFFPDMSAAEMEEAEFVFERSYMSKRNVRKLLKRPGFIEENVKLLMAKDPREFRIDTHHLERIREAGNHSQLTDAADNRYEIWTYHGSLDADDLMACGCNEEDIDPTEIYDAVVWFCGSIVLMAQVNIMDTDEWPYSVFNWEGDESSIFGYGVPYRMRNAQKVINASWRMTLENAGLSTGPQIVLNKDNIVPANGSWEMTPRKVWYVTDKNTPVNNTFATFDINSHQPELMAIFESAKRLADEETSLPAITQGDLAEGQGKGNVEMALNYANVMLRRAVKQYDDDVTTTLIARYYDWNMQFNEKDEIKGDYEIEARGATVLMEREIQVRHLMHWMQLANNSVFAKAIKPNNLLKGLAKFHQMRDVDAVKTDEEMEADAKAEEGKQPQDPAIIRAQTDQANMKLKMDTTYKMHQERMAKDMQELEYKKLDRQKEFEIQVMKLMQDREMSVEQIKAELAKVAMKTNAESQKEIDALVAEDEALAE